MGAIRGHDIILHNIKVLGQDKFIRGETYIYKNYGQSVFQELWTTSFSSPNVKIIHWALR